MKTTPRGPPNLPSHCSEPRAKEREGAYGEIWATRNSQKQPRAWVTEPFLRKINNIAETARGADRFPALGSLACRSCWRQRQAGASPGTRRRCHQRCSPQPTEPPKLPLSPKRKNLLPLGQLLAAAGLPFHHRNPTEFYSSSVPSYSFLFLPVSLFCTPYHGKL